MAAPGWFLTAIGVVYGALLVIVLAWLGQRAAKSVRPGRVAGGDTGDWIASVAGALVGFVLALAVVKRGGIAPMFMPLVLLCGLWAGATAGSVLLRLTVRPHAGND